MLAMLRAAADVVMIGAGTLRANAGHQWTVASVAGSHLDALQEYRADLGRSSDAAPLVVVTGSGQLPSHVALTRPQTEPIVVTTAAGAGASGAGVVFSGAEDAEAGAGPDAGRPPGTAAVGWWQGAITIRPAPYVAG